MGAAIALRGDYDSADLRRLAKKTKDAGQSRRLLVVAGIYDGDTRTEAARNGCVGVQVIRDWVLHFNADGPEGLIDGKACGQPPKLNDEQRKALAQMVKDGPVLEIHGVVRWRLKDLALWIYEEYHISLDETTVGRTLKALGFAKILARPHHYGQDEFAIEDFKKNIQSELAKIRNKLLANTAIEFWWQDEARVGQKTKLTRRWALRGTRPRAPKDQRTKSAYIFGAICPERGVGAALVLPDCNSQAMQWHLNEISSQVTPRAHAIVFVDRAAWHTTDKLIIPSNITLLPLPPRSPELNPVENIWQYMRDNWLSNCIFQSYDEIVALCCEAWNKLIDQPSKIMSIGKRQWVHGY